MDGSDKDLDTILKMADEAMYEAKHKGKGQYTFSADNQQYWCLLARVKLLYHKL